MEDESLIDWHVLCFIYMLHEGISLKVSCTPQYHLTSAIGIRKGIKQECILSPQLFNFYISSMVGLLLNTNFHPQNFLEDIISLFYSILHVYANNTATLSRRPTGLKRALKALSTVLQGRPTSTQLSVNHNHRICQKVQETLLENKYP